MIAVVSQAVEAPRKHRVVLGFVTLFVVAIAIAGCESGEDSRLQPSSTPHIERLPQGAFDTLAALTVLVRSSDGTGSGLMWFEDSSQQAIIFTNRHVVQDSDTQEVCWAVAQACEEGAVVLVANESTDAAMVILPKDSTISKTMLSWWANERFRAAMAFENSWSKGDVVFAFGYPGGNNIGEKLLVSEPMVTEGIITHGGTVRYNGIEYIEHGADLAPGSSGGPLVNSTGEIIGIATGSNKFAERLELAIPIADFLAGLTESVASQPSLDPQPKGTPEAGLSSVMPTVTPKASAEISPPCTPEATATPVPTPESSVDASGTTSIHPELHNQYRGTRFRAILGEWENSIPTNISVSIADWKVSVKGSGSEGHESLPAISQITSAPESDIRYVIVQIQGTYKGETCGSMHSDLDFHLFDNADGLYAEQDFDTPPPFSLSQQPAVTPEETMNGSVVFLVPKGQQAIRLIITGIDREKDRTVHGYFRI